MADNKKEQERGELHRTIWSIANDLRGSVDGWDFKQYVLSMLFYRYISENLCAYINRGEKAAGAASFDYENLSDDKAELARVDLVSTKGFFMLPSELFANVRKRCATDENLNETLESVFKNIEASARGYASEEDFRGLFDDIDVNSKKLGNSVARRNERLVKLMNGVGEMKLGDYQDNTIDAFGDAYEYLMGMYASNAGKSGGEYYTPQEVSELLTRLTLVGKTQVNKVYDPACGSGSLLLNFAKILGKENVRQGFYGQEINITTYNLCRINMFLHDIDYDKFNIGHGDTLTDPLHESEEPFEAIVSNPPYSINWEGKNNPLLINDPRYSPAGVLAPHAYADLAFIMHSLAWLASNGTAAIVCFPGILYRGGAEEKIRKYLVDNNFVDCVIQLPENLFFGTTIPTCILVLKRSKAEASTLFIDASNEFVSVTNNNKLSFENIKKIEGVFSTRRKEEYFSALVKNDLIAKLDYNLSVPTYVEEKDTREIVDISTLNTEIELVVEREQAMRTEISEILMEYEYYKNKFSDNSNNEFEIRNLGGSQGICDVKASGVDKKLDDTEQKILLCNYMDVYRNQYITRELSQKFMPGSVKTNEYNNFVLKKGQILLTKDSETRKDIGQSSYVVEDLVGVVCGYHLAVLTPKVPINGKYLNFVLQSFPVKTYLSRMANGVTRFGLKLKTIENAQIPLPPLAEQERIVAILDRFEALVNDLTTGLPAELAARRKQYEYYRERLLTFREKGA